MRTQFRLRSLLLATMWFALVLAICVQYQHAATKHRETLDALNPASVLLPGQARYTWQPPAARRTSDGKP